MGACWLERLLPDAARPSQWRSGRRFKAEAERRPLKCRSHTGPLGAGQPHRGSSGGPPHSSETGGRADLRFWHLERRVELGNTKTLLQAPKSRGGLVAHRTVPLRPATLTPTSVWASIWHQELFCSISSSPGASGNARVGDARAVSRTQASRQDGGFAVLSRLDVLPWSSGILTACTRAPGPKGDPGEPGVVGASCTPGAPGPGFTGTVSSGRFLCHTPTARRQESSHGEQRRARPTGLPPLPTVSAGSPDQFSGTVLHQ